MSLRPQLAPVALPSPPPLGPAWGRPASCPGHRPPAPVPGPHTCESQSQITAHKNCTGFNAIPHIQGDRTLFLPFEILQALDRRLWPQEDGSDRWGPCICVPSTSLATPGPQGPDRDSPRCMWPGPRSGAGERPGRHRLRLLSQRRGPHWSPQSTFRCPAQGRVGWAGLHPWSTDPAPNPKGALTAGLLGAHFTAVETEVHAGEGLSLGRVGRVHRELHPAHTYEAGPGPHRLPPPPDHSEMTPRSAGRNKAFIFTDCSRSLRVPGRCLSGGVSDSCSTWGRNWLFPPQIRIPGRCGQRPCRALGQPKLALRWRGPWARAQRCGKQTLGPKGKLRVCAVLLGSGVAHPLSGVLGRRAMGGTAKWPLLIDVPLPVCRV